MTSPITTIDRTPVGPVHLSADADGLTHLVFGTSAQRCPPGDGSAASRQIIDDAVAQLREYFDGRRRRFDLPLNARGTDFQRTVWRALVEIPFGRTVSYSELARRIYRPRAVRAVGAANGANPIAIVVPCHRVIGSDGRLTGYGGGLPAKKRLLAHEGLRLLGEKVIFARESRGADPSVKPF